MRVQQKPTGKNLAPTEKAPHEQHRHDLDHDRDQEEFRQGKQAFRRFHDGLDIQVNVQGVLVTGAERQE